MSSAKKATKKAVASHPPYVNMARAAIKPLKEPKGSSRQAILKYILANYKVGTDIKAVNTRLRLALRRGVQSKQLTQKAGSNGRFRLGDSATAKSPKTARKRTVSKKSPAKAKRPAAKKTKKVAAAPAAGEGAAAPAAAKKSTPKKKKSPAKKKAAATKKSPAKKTKKSPAKKAAKKSPAKKKVAKKSK